MTATTTRPPMAADARQMIDLLKELGFPAMETLPPADTRAIMAQMPRARARELAAVENTTLPGPAGEIPVRLYRPRAFNAAAPCLLFLHGGGWVVCTLDTYDAFCSELAVAGDCVVISVDYRLAPEHAYPAAIDDAVAAFNGVVAHAERLGIDPRRIAVGGDSAGGNLAAALCLRTRAAGGVQPCLQLLYYPVVDAVGQWPSYAENATGCFLTQVTMEWCWHQYAGQTSAPWPEDLAPLQATSHANLPAALVVTAGYDLLRDEGNAYAERLLAAGVPTVLRQYPAQIHGFLMQGADAADCIAASGVELRRAFEPLLIA